MGRKAVRPDKKLRSRTFSLSEGHLALIETYADVYDLSSSQALRRLLDVAELHIDSEVRLEANQRRALLARRGKYEVRAQQITRTDKCPSCGDSLNIVHFSNGRWECNLCRATGTDS